MNGWKWLTGALLSAVLAACGSGEVVPPTAGSDPAGTTASPGSSTAGQASRTEAAGGGGEAAGVSTEPVTRTYEGPVDRVELDVDSGDVELRAGPPEGPVEVTRTARFTDEPPVVTQALEGGVLSLSADCPENSRPCAVDYVVMLPAATPAAVQVAGGDIIVDDLTGNLRLKTAAGDVRGTELGSETVAAEVAAGEVELMFAAAPQQVDARAAAGDITVGVPAGEAYRVEAGSVLGVVVVAVPADAGAPRTITAQSTTGDVTVTGS